MDPEDQSSIPTKHVIMTRSGEPSQAISNSIAAAMLGAGRPPAGAWQPPSPEELQRDFPQYEITAVLGRGGMGAVYKGWQKSLDRFVAIKILPPGLDDGIAGFTERFKREAKAMAQLKHPGIVAVFDAGTTAGGMLYFIMECVEGTDVHQLLAASGKLPPAQALGITSAVCDALGYAHDHGVIHRDIKPSNIMIEADGVVKIADFGLAKSTSPETTMLTGANVAMGTPDFMAPEARTGTGNVDHRADIYAVGVMLYQMLTGKIPRGRFDPPSRAVPGLDRRVDAIVDRTLQSDPAARYSTAIELCTALAPVLTGAVAKRDAANRANGANASRKKPLLIAAAVAGITAIAALVHFAPWKKAGANAAKPASGPAADTRIAALVADPANWVDWLKTKKWEAPWVLENGVLKTTDKTKMSGTLAIMRDGAIRVRVRASGSSGTQLQLILRSGSVPGVKNTAGLYQIQTTIGATTCSIIYFERKNGAETQDRLCSWTPLPAALAGQTEVEWEFRAVGDELSAWGNGQLVASAHDSRVPVGVAAFFSDTGLEITKLETINFGTANANASDVQNITNAPLDKAASVPTPAAPAADARIAALAANPANWVDWLKTKKWEAPWVLENGVLKTTDKTKMSGTLATMRDGAIRVRVRASGSSGTQLQLILRSGSVPGVKNTAGLYQIQVNGNGTVCTLHYAERRDGDAKTETRETLWRDTALPAALAGQTELELEFRVVGDEFSLIRNGQFVASAHHTRVPVGSAAFVSGTSLEFTKVETIDFASGAAPPAPAKKPSASYPKPAAWIDATNDVGRKLVDSKLAVFEDGQLHVIKGVSNIPVADGREFRNAIVRLTCTGVAHAFVRKPDAAGARYDASAGSTGGGSVAYIDPAQKADTFIRREIGIPSAAFDPDAEHEIVLAAQEDRFTLWVDGEEKATLRDTTLARGTIGVQVNTFDGATGKVRLRKIEYAELPETAPAK